ncbi:MAG: DUF1570 domain-containing protein [Methylobacterium sp.]|nr:DUF1570 domain-containing protein [Methylobacterium sp.]
MTFKAYAFLIIALFIPLFCSGSEDCSENSAIELWHSTNQHLKILFENEIKQPPKFVIYHQSSELPFQEGNQFLGNYNRETGEISVACLDGNAFVFNKIVRHESTHYYLHQIYGFVPMWIDEGLASYMEVESLENNGNLQNINKPRLDEFIHMLKKGQALSIENVIKDQFSGSHPSQFYATCWALIYALLHHKEPEVQIKRRDLLLKILAVLKSKQYTPGQIYAFVHDEIIQQEGSIKVWQEKIYRQIWAIR